MKAKVLVIIAIVAVGVFGIYYAVFKPGTPAATVHLNEHGKAKSKVITVSANEKITLVITGEPGTLGGKVKLEKIIGSGDKLELENGEVTTTYVSAGKPPKGDYALEFTPADPKTINWNPFNPDQRARAIAQAGKLNRTFKGKYQDTGVIIRVQ